MDPELKRRLDKIQSDIDWVTIMVLIIFVLVNIIAWS